MVESCLQWFGHVRRRAIDAPLRKVNQTEDSPVSRRKRPRKTIVEIIRKNFELNGLPKDVFLIKHNGII